MDKTATSMCVMLHFGEWMTRKVFHVSMPHAPKKDELLGLIFVGFKVKGIHTLSQVCRIKSVTYRNLDGNLHVTASIKSDMKIPFAHIDAEDCYVISV